MERVNLITAFTKLGELMVDLGENRKWSGYASGVTEAEYEALNQLIIKEHIYNGWFTESSIRNSLLALGLQLNRPSLENWLSNYQFGDKQRLIAIIMAGNIPIVGFHDLLCVLLSGNKALVKLSSDDKRLLPALTNVLIQFDPNLQSAISYAVGPIKDFDAVIATGSDNSAMYFESYFGKYPHIFRKNRTSIAVLNGAESSEDLIKLGQDIFDYYGLGCRNVSHILLPNGFDLDRIFSAIIGYNEVIYNKKYGNNYDYNKAVFLMNKVPLLDNNFVLFRETEDLFSPLAMVHYHYYTDKKEVDEYIAAHQDKIQVVIGEGYIPFGEAQCPMLSDYADGVDTMKWLSEL